MEWSMMRQLKSFEWAKLLSEDESGMGYQIVRAVVETKSILAFVFNAELLMTEEELALFHGNPYDYLLKRAVATSPSFELREVVKVADFEATAMGDGSTVVTAPRSVSKGGPLAPSPLLRATTSADEGFVRFTPYPDDRRVTAAGGVKRGTYATTMTDARFAVSGLAVAGRYALPNPAPAVYARTIVAPKGIDISVGTVRPAYAQSGGGVEVLFDQDCPPGSAFKPYKISDR
jgi:hypothetical protein